MFTLVSPQVLAEFNVPKSRRTGTTILNGCDLLQAGNRGLCVKDVTEPDSAESTEITERSGPKLRKTADNYDLSIPIFSSVTGSI